MREFIGKIDDTFVFTKNNDVITFTPSAGVGEKIHKTETNLDSLADAVIYNDALLIAGDGDEVSYVDKDGGLHPLYDGSMTENIHTDVDWSNSVEATVFMMDDDYSTVTIYVNPDWSLHIFV